MATTQGQLGGHTVHTHPGHTDPSRAYTEGTRPEEIKRDIDRTRAEMDCTINELGDRLNPRHLLDDVLDLFRSDDGQGNANYRQTAKNVGKRLVRQVKRHPVPAMLFGAGLAYLMLEDDEDDAARRRIRRNAREPRMYSGSYVDARTGEPYDDSYGEEWHEKAEPYGDDFPHVRAEEPRGPGWGERARDALSAVGEKLSGMGHTMKETASGAASSVAGAASSVAGAASGAASKTGEWAGQAGHMMGRAGQRTGEMGRRAGSGARQYGARMGRGMQSGYAWSAERFGTACEENPLAVGLGFLALGALAGLVIPRTRREDEMMGQKSDRLKEQAREMGEDLLDRGKQVVSATTETVKDDIREEGLTKGSMGEKLQHVAQSALHAARETAHDEGIAPSDLADKARGMAQHARDAAKHEAKQQAKDVVPQTREAEHTTAGTSSERM